MMLSSLVEVRSAGDAGNGCFARKGGSDEQGIQAGTKLLEGALPIVWAVKDQHERTNCRLCVCYYPPPTTLSSTGISQPLSLVQ